MRYEMQEIVTGLYLGPHNAAKRTQFDRLKSVGITHIVCVRHGLEANIVKPTFPTEFQYLVLDIADSPYQNILPLLPTARNFTNLAFAAGGRVLVHGVTGISRSAALVIGYLMETHILTYEAAFSLVQGRRFCAFPNAGFVQQLQEYYYMLEAALAVSSRAQLFPNPGERAARKRQLEEDAYEDADWNAASAAEE
eukprot:m.279157 g.279157  ORF g.279157 m.279157 type:complete len:195 (+) comp54901_c0_seq3:108-692(+)